MKQIMLICLIELIYLLNNVSSMKLCLEINALANTDVSKLQNVAPCRDAACRVIGHCHPLTLPITCKSE